MNYKINPDIVTYKKLTKEEQAKYLSSIFIKKFTSERMFIPGKKKKTIVNPIFFKLYNFFNKLDVQKLFFLYSYAYSVKGKKIISLIDFFNEAEKYHRDEFISKNTYTKTTENSGGDDYSDFLKKIGIEL